MRIVTTAYHNDESLEAWALETCQARIATPIPLEPGQYQALIAIDHYMTPHAAFLYYNHNSDCSFIEMACAAVSPRWATPQALAGVFNYPFDQLGCQFILTSIAGNNDRMLRLAHGCGSKLTFVPNGRGSCGDEYRVVLSASDWRNSRIGRRAHGSVV